MARPPTTAKGQRAEVLAARYLQDRGYRLVTTNFRCRRGEIDIIAEDGDVLCFVEVRSRANAALGHPLETVGMAKQARLIRAARYYLATHRGCADRFTRFDVVGIVYRPRLDIRLVQGAFEAG